MIYSTLFFIYFSALPRNKPRKSSRRTVPHEVRQQAVKSVKKSICSVGKDTGISMQHFYVM